MKPKLNIVKIGGNIIENAAELDKFLELFADLDMPKILVHGGGKMASALESKLGIESKYFNGRRNSNNQSKYCKYISNKRIHTRHKHMVSPYDK